MIFFKKDRQSDRDCAGVWIGLTIGQTMMRALKTSGGLTRGRAVTESIHKMRIYTMHSCAEIRTAMNQFTKSHCVLVSNTKVMGQTKIETDYSDLTTIVHWFRVHNPFNENQTKLNSLKSDSHLLKLFCFICFIESPLKIMKLVL